MPTCAPSRRPTRIPSGSPRQHAAETGAQYLSPYSHPDLLAAIGTIALEVIEDLPQVDRIVVPVGGGGLIAGIAIAARERRREIEVVGVEVEASHPFATSLAAGRIVEVQVGPTIADGLAGNMDPDNIAFPVVQALVPKMVIVGEGELRAAVRGLVRHEHLVAEGAGAAGVAAVAAGVIGSPSRTTAVIVSGANINLDLLAQILERESLRITSSAASRTRAVYLRWTAWAGREGGWRFRRAGAPGSASAPRGPA